jgi:hypothetical protein
MAAAMNHMDPFHGFRLAQLGGPAEEGSLIHLVNDERNKTRLRNLVG